MRAFWRGFEEKRANAGGTNFKRHAIVFYWSGDQKDVRDVMNTTRMRHPTVKVKVVNCDKDRSKMGAHGVKDLPAIILLKDGREVDRVTGKPSRTLLERLFRKATT